MVESWERNSEELLGFINEAASPYHTVEAVVKLLDKAGFSRLAR